MFYQIFLQLCTENGVSPSAVAEAIGVTRKAATGWKNGAMPQKATLKKLAEYFKVPVGFLLEGESWYKKDIFSQYDISGNDLDKLIQLTHTDQTARKLFSEGVKKGDGIQELVDYYKQQLSIKRCKQEEIDEQWLLDKYRQLNDAGKSYVRQSLDMAVSKYNKDEESEESNVLFNTTIEKGKKLSI